MLIATAGHVDHGKTALVLALTGVDTDRLPEEKKRGLTIDLGFAYQDLGNGRTLGFVDVPGHERFVRNMLAGVAAIDFGLLIVASDDGPMPQTHEHLAILDLLGIRQIAVALTKIDKVDGQRVAELEKAVEELLDGGKFAGAPVFPVSAPTGAGMEPLRKHLRDAAEAHQARATHGNFRLAVDRSFTVSGVGLVVTGAVFSGKLAVGERVLLLPAGVGARVRAIHAQNQPSEESLAGQRCALNLAGSGLKRTDIHRGDWLVAPSLTATTQRIDARLRVAPSEALPLAHWSPVHVHLGAASLTGRLAVLEDRSIAPSEQGLVQIVLAEATSAVHGDRFVLRDQSAQRTIAGGTVIDPLAPPRGRARPARIAFLKTMETKDTAQALLRLLDQERNGVDLDSFEAARNLTPEEAAACVAGAEAVVVRTRRARVGISSSRWSALRDELLHAVRRWHEEHPEDAVGLDGARLGQALAGQSARVLMPAALESLIREGVLVREGSNVRLVSHSPTLSPQEAALWERVQRHVSEQNLRPPVVIELAELLRVDVQSLDAFLGRLVRRGQLVRLARNRCFHPQAVAELARVAECLAEERESGMFDVKSYRDRSGLGRGLAIQVLEYFDATGLSRRIGDERKVIGRAEELFGKPQN